MLKGVENRFQSYNWIGTQILEGEIGSTGNLFLKILIIVQLLIMEI